MFFFIGSQLLFKICLFVAQYLIFIFIKVYLCQNIYNFVSTIVFLWLLTLICEYHTQLCILFSYFEA